MNISPQQAELNQKAIVACVEIFAFIVRRLRRIIHVPGCEIL